MSEPAATPPRPGGEGAASPEAADGATPAVDDGATGGATPRALRREVLATFAASVLLTGGLNQALRLAPGLGPYLYLLVAAVFIGLPTLVVRRWRGADPDAAGMTFEPVRRGLGLGLGLTLLTALPFAAGHHLWQTQALGARAEPAWSNHLRWPVEVEGFPEALREPGRASPGVYVWAERQTLRVWWLDEARAEGALAVRVEAPLDALTPSRPIRALVTVEGAGRWQARATGVSGGVDWTRAGAPLEGARLTALRDGAPLPGSTLRLGASAQPAADAPLVLELGWLWLLSLTLTQWLFIALPEEYFYRGYVQPTLARASNASPARGQRLRAAQVVVMTSALFALGHLLVEWHWTRGMVFFPSLVFGWLRLRSGGLIAPTLYHGCCNMMVEVARVHYAPD